MNMDKRLMLAIDLGTSGPKAVLVAQDGSTLPKFMGAP